MRRSCLSYAVGLGLLAVSACRVTDLPLWSPPNHAENAVAVQKLRGIDYGGEPNADPLRHRLDLFLPKNVKNYPVVVLVHGGAWMMGDNRCCGRYSSVGESLASRGIGAVMPNYRLSPGVKHPEHIKDVARAVAWTRAHIGEYGGDTKRLFLAGHSAGGHLVSLLATDESYLKAEGLSAADFKGVISISGVYRIPTGKMDVKVGGADAESFRFDEVTPIRRQTPDRAPLAAVQGMPLNLNVFGPAFGDDPEARALASPINHVRPGLPPFLLISAGHDLPTLAVMADDFHQALREKGCDARLLRVPDRNHNSIMFMAMQDRDPVARAMVEFVRRNAEPVSAGH
jgi:acetyl esterase/lipase